MLAALCPLPNRRLFRQNRSDPGSHAAHIRAGNVARPQSVGAFFVGHAAITEVRPGAIAHIRLPAIVRSGDDVLNGLHRLRIGRRLGRDDQRLLAIRDVDVLAGDLDRHLVFSRAAIAFKLETLRRTGSDAAIGEVGGLVDRFLSAAQDAHDAKPGTGRLLRRGLWCGLLLGYWRRLLRCRPGRWSAVLGRHPGHQFVSGFLPGNPAVRHANAALVFAHDNGLLINELYDCLLQGRQAH